MLGARKPLVYSRAERWSDAAVHILGVISALVATSVLITLAAVWFDDRATVTALAVYGVCTILMLTCSAFYQISRHPGWSDRLRRFDQSAIYMKIAGTYTPFAVLAGSPAMLLLGGIWGVAVAGAGAIMFGPHWLRRPSLLAYLVIGWAGFFFGGAMFEAMSPEGFRLIVIGGCLYTSGVIFYLWERLPFHNTIWHIFVLTATAVLYCAVFVEAAGRAAPLETANLQPDTGYDGTERIILVAGQSGGLQPAVPVVVD